MCATWLGHFILRCLPFLVIICEGYFFNLSQAYNKHFYSLPIQINGCNIWEHLSDTISTAVVIQRRMGSESDREWKVSWRRRSWAYVILLSQNYFWEAEDHKRRHELITRRIQLGYFLNTNVALYQATGLLCGVSWMRCGPNFNLTACIGDLNCLWGQPYELGMDLIYRVIFWKQ